MGLAVAVYLFSHHLPYFLYSSNMVKFEGTYTHVKSENLDAHLEKSGIPWPMRKMMTSSSPTLEVSIRNDEWTFKFVTTIKNKVIKFKMNQQFEEESPDGKEKVMVTPSMEGDDTVVLKGQNTKYGDGSRRFCFTDNDVTMTLINDTAGSSAKRYFKRSS